MKKNIPVLLTFLVMVSLSSCSQKIYTHQQVVQNLHTKDEVLKQLGNPDEIKAGDEVQEWTYTHDIRFDAKGMVKKDTTMAIKTIPDTLNTVARNKNGKYIRFLFDKDGNVTGYKSSGMDLGYKKKDSFGTSLLKGVGVAAIIIVVVGLDVYNNSDISY